MEGKKKSFDFCGWATRNNIKCSDGRTIRENAFKHNDGETVPLVWNHNHQSADNILGHALLENRTEGVYAYCSFNSSEQGQTAKELVKHGDICALSIYANQLKQSGSGDVIHGNIREVSLVLAGANPGAKIENVMVHSDDNTIEAIINNSSETFEFDVEKEVIEHEDKSSDDKTVQEVFDTLTEEQKTVVYALIGQAIENAKSGAYDNVDEEVSHSDEDDDVVVEDDADDDVTAEDNANIEHADGERTVEDVINEFTDEQKKVVEYLIQQAVENAQNKTQEDNKEMKQNAFEQLNNNQGSVLTHAEIVSVFEEAKSKGSLKEAVNNLLKTNETCIQHGIDHIDVLFPDFKSVKAPSTYDDSNNNWVRDVMSNTHHSPFSRVKSSYFDLTGEDARARGYVKGNQKLEEVIAAFKRTTDPQTIYKLQKLDRDDIIDITDFDVVAYVKQEMRTKLDREIARAILIGDGRSVSSPDKINPLHIRPILGDDPVYTIAKTMTRESGENEYAYAKRFIREAIKARKQYKGSGNLTLYCTEDLLTDMLLIEDKNERVIYDTVEKLKTALMVKNIVPVPEFENQTRTVGNKQLKLMGIFVNLNDYNVGADKGGAVNMFDDFDLNFNKYEYLIETRCSGALTEPYSAITFEEEVNFQQASE